jgi:phosphoenolpyruvate carboxykinase (ATP)
LTREQAMLWFMMGYTSKLAGTETGITEPQVTFSRFFGAPFMPFNPDMYASMLGEKMDKHQSRVLLVKTGWRGVTV